MTMSHSAPTLTLVVFSLLFLLSLLVQPLLTSGQSCSYTTSGTTFTFSSLSSYDIYGVDGSAGSNQDSFYIGRICGSVSDPACNGLSGGSMHCKHQFYYSQIPNGGTQGNVHRYRY